MSTFHFYSEFDSTDPDTVRCNAAAKESWRDQGWIEVPVRDEELPRLWVEDDHRLPFIKDVFDKAVARAESDDDIFIFTNTDSYLRPGTRARVEEKLSIVSACYCHRIDVPDLVHPMPNLTWALLHSPGCIDLMAFRAYWWREHGATLENLLVGVACWDSCFAALARHTNPKRNVEFFDLVSHEKHRNPPWWASKGFQLQALRWNHNQAFRILHKLKLNPRKVCGARWFPTTKNLTISI